MLRRVVILLFVISALLWSAMASNHRLSEAERRGKRIYLRGESLSGRAIIATLGGNDAVEVPAATLPCAGCHGADGKGKPEGGVLPSNVTWSALTKSYGHTHPDGRTHAAFDELSSERAIVEGIDPAGNKLSVAMPKYQMSRADMADLLAYLKRLETDHDPGITTDTITIATLLPNTGAMAETGAAMHNVLAAYFAELNQAGGIHHRRFALQIVTPEEAPKLLADESVFALVGAMIAGKEQAMTTLIAREEVPLLGPFTLYPDASSPPERHTFYLFGGLSEQAQALVQFAAQQFTPASTRIAVLTVEDERGSRAASELAAHCNQTGWQYILPLTYARGRLADTNLVQRLRQEKVDAVFFLGASGDEKALLEEAAKQNLTFPLFMPGALVTKDTLTALPRFKQKIYLSYPTLPTDHASAASQAFRALLARHNITPRHTAAQLSAYVAAQLLTEGLKRAGRDVTREKLIVALEGLYEYDTGLTPRLTYGPNRRIGARGAYVVTFDPTKKQITPASEWINLD
ncbi:MAG TPA: ABC transporter substrate-binding protein [Blastocatellia bacterium]|nr:ABC transporter substrate-binding protein [Blastocatellia bacterium]